MSSFTEFQALVLGKLCSIEERISVIEEVLGISEYTSDESDLEPEYSEPDNAEDDNNYHRFKNDIFDFQNQLSDIKSLFSENDN